MGKVTAFVALYRAGSGHGGVAWLPSDRTRAFAAVMTTCGLSCPVQAGPPHLFPTFPRKTTVGSLPKSHPVSRAVLVADQRSAWSRWLRRRSIAITVRGPLSKYWLRPRQSPAVFLQTCRQPAYLKMWRPPAHSRRPLLPQIGTRPVQQCMCSWLASTFTGRPCCNPVSGIKLVQHPLGLHDPSVRF